MKQWVTMIRFCIEKAEQARGTEWSGLFSLEGSVLACLLKKKKKSDGVVWAFIHLFHCWGSVFSPSQESSFLPSPIGVSQAVDNILRKVSLSTITLFRKKNLKKRGEVAIAAKIKYESVMFQG